MKPALSLSLTLTLTLASTAVVVACSASPPRRDATSEQDSTITEGDDAKEKDDEAAPPSSAKPSADAGKGGAEDYSACMRQCSGGDAKVTAIVEALDACGPICPKDKTSDVSQACADCIEAIGVAFDQHCGTDKTATQCPKFYECDEQCWSPAAEGVEGEGK